MKKRTLHEWLAPVWCNLLTFIAVFVIIPLFMWGMPDVIWITARIIAAIVLAVWFGTKYPPMYAIEIFLWSVVQDLMAYIFRVPLADMYGISMSSPLWEFEYIGQFCIWITALSVLQSIVIKAKRNFIDKK